MNKHYIWVKSKCDNYYKFISKVNNISIQIEEIKYVDKWVYLKIEERELKKLNKYLLSYKFVKVNDLGLYKIKNIIYRYKEFVGCLLISMVLFIICSNLIVDIQIVHENKEIRELLSDELESYGIKKLSFKKSYKKIQEIKNAILEKYPDRLDWLEIENDGMIYKIRVEERIITDTKKEDRVCNIVAKKDGTITGMKLYHGVSVVSLNDYVKEGDILISGILVYNEEEKSRVCASGEVYAQTWYTASVSIPFDYNIYKETGKTKYNIVINNDGNKYKIFRDRFGLYDVEYKTLLDIFDIQILLEKEKETKKIREEYTEEEALEIALNKAEDNLKIKLGEKDEVITKKVLKKSINDSKMEVEVFMVVNELISIEEEIIEENVEGNDSNDN